MFPIELADIRDAHVVLHGGDPFAGWGSTRPTCACSWSVS